MICTLMNEVEDRDAINAGSRWASAQRNEHIEVQQNRSRNCGSYEKIALIMLLAGSTDAIKFSLWNLLQCPPQMLMLTIPSINGVSTNNDKKSNCSGHVPARLHVKLPEHPAGSEQSCLPTVATPSVSWWHSFK